MKSWKTYIGIMDKTLGDSRCDGFGIFSAIVTTIAILIVDFFMNFIGNEYDFPLEVYIVTFLCVVFYPITLLIIALPFIILEACYVVLNRYVFKLEEK